MVPQTRSINLTLNHIVGEYANYMLNECGWSDRIDFEMNAPTENNFPFDIKNNLIDSQPNYNLTFNPMYNLYQLSIQSLTTFTKTYLYKLLNNKSVFEYELDNPQSKIIYIHFPIKSKFMSQETDGDKLQVSKKTQISTMTGLLMLFISLIVSSNSLKFFALRPTA